ncbi:MAG: DUF2169 domain-containing protein [Polyangiaceae bacterium]
MSYVAVSPVGRVSAATVLWRHRGQRNVTAVVKATFALVPEGRMTQVDPVAIAFGEQADPYGIGLAEGGDVAPLLREAGVTVVGHVQLPPHFTSDEVHVELELARGREIVLDRQLVLDGSKRVGPEQRHVHVQGMAPLSREWPVRASHLGGADPADLLPPDMTVPDDFDWAYFQAAPMEQRVARLAGDEWLILGGFFLERPRLRTLLPAAHGAARLYRSIEPTPRGGEPISMVLDTVHIDVDQHLYSLVWRGAAPVHGCDPMDLRVVAGVELPGQPIEWLDPIERSEDEARAARVKLADALPSLSRASDSDLSATMMLTTEES